ncbi:hypothetical protein JB92DRAFT_1495370 [Gautieria morchelliformis]|nr:hypothetical protein JB92DRAFT_1495370 [Gautieria morchelliformis]
MELKVIQLLSSAPLRADPWNHTIPLFEVLDVREWSIIVTPEWGFGHWEPCASIEEYLEYARQLLQGLAFMHQKGIIHVIVEYMPLSHSPDTLAEMRKIERELNLPDGSLLSTCQIKPIHRRSLGQKSAHIITKFTTTKAANQSIRDGIIVAGKCTWARRMKREPHQCLKCQRYNSRVHQPG